MRYLFFIISLLLITSSCSSLSKFDRDLASYENECLKSAEKILRKNPIKSGPIKTDDGSLYSHIPDHENYRAKLLESRPSITNYSRNYQEKYGEVPSFKMVLEFYFQAHINLVANIRSAMGNNRELNYFLQEAAKAIELPGNTYAKYKTMFKHPEMKARLEEPFNISNDSQRKTLGKLHWPQYKGHLGELDVLLRLEHVTAHSVFFKKMNVRHKGTSKFNELLSSRTEEAFSTIDASQVNELSKKYPRIFKKKPGLSDEEILLRARNFIDGKEIDIVLKKGEKYIFVEVKNYKKAIGTSEAKVSDLGNSGKKTILDQQIEDLEILEFLGLRDVVYPSVAFLRGVKPSALKIFESYGISVLARVHEDQ